MAPTESTAIFKIGVLALQGAFEEHQALFNALPSELVARLEVVQVRTGAQLNSCDALVIPGGESTTMKIISNDNGACEGFMEQLRTFVHGCPGQAPRPVWGTCAGCILLSDDTVNERPGAQGAPSKRCKFGETIGGLDILTCRNYFGRQVASFEVNVQAGDGDDVAGQLMRQAFAEYPAVFIRAPAILKCGEGVRVLARARHPLVPEERGVVVAAEKGHVMVTCFHPELSSDSRVHQYFVERHVLKTA